MKHWDKWKDERQYTFWIMTGVMAGILAAAVFWGRGIWVRYKDTILENQQQQLLLTVQGVSDSLEVFIEEYKSDLLGLRLEAEKAGGLSWSEAASTDFIKNYVESHETYVADVIVEDCQGRLLSRIGDNEIVQVTSVTDMGEGFSLRQCRMETGSYNLVLRQEAEGACTISIVIDAKAYFQSLISDLHVGTNGYIMVKDSK